MKNINFYKKIFFVFLAALAIVLFDLVLISFIEGRISLANIENGWDGTTVASEFAGGNGSSENPFLISNGDELALFKSVIENNSDVYADKYYQLSDDVNMGNHDYSTIAKEFKGHFDGRGYSINNVKFTKSTINDVDYYGLFSYVTAGSIMNLTFNDVNIVTDESNFDVVTGIIAGKVLPEENAVIKNIAITGANLDVTKTAENVNNFIGGVVGLIGYNTTFGNIYTQITINSNYYSGIGSLVSTINSDPGVTITKTTSVDDDIAISTYSNSSDVIKKDNKIYLDGEEVDDKDDYKIITDLLNVDIGRYLWKYVDGNFVFAYKTVSKAPKFVLSGSVFTPTPSTVDTANNITTVNMLDEDYNYFKGLNYTEVRSKNLPPVAGTNYYTDDTLVAVKVTYDGADINDNTLIGAVSPINSENTNKFVYYKYYALERNSDGTLATDSGGHNYIKIELIDNPFSKRPYVNGVEYGFNGWVCNQNSETSDGICDSSTFVFDNDDYTRYMNIPITGGSEIKVYLSASWHKATVIANNSANATTLNDGFKSMSMQPATHTETIYTQVTGILTWKNNYATFNQNGTVNSYNRIARYTYYKDDIDSDTYYYSGNNRPYCYNWNGCPTYTVNQNGIVGNSVYNGGVVEFVPNFVNNGTNYSVTVNGYNADYMNVVADPNGSTYTVPSTRTVLDLPNGTTAGGYFYQVTGTTAAMVNTKEYYNANGTLCTTASSCNTSYKLIQYNDSVTNSDGTSIYNINYTPDDPSTPADESQAVNMDKYYYLVTRDQNIFRYTATNLSRDVLQVDRPLTITGTNVNATTVSGSINMNNTTLTANNDLVIENIEIYGPSNSGVSNQDFGYGNTQNPILICNSKNVKIGRNVTSSRNDSYINLSNITAGTNNNTATSGKIKIIVESGFYNAYRVTNSSSASTFNLTSILGSDYDKAGNDNSKLKFMVGVVGMTTSNVNYNLGNASPFLTFTYLKSGYYGYNPNGNPSTAPDGSGIYLGGRGGSTKPGGPCGAKIEGGIVNIILGGSGINGNDNDNLIYLAMTSGSLRQVYTGATQSTTRGNRIINITGGTVQGSVFGGSYSRESSVGNGAVNATALVYIGGNATIGGETGAINGVDTGSVFGAGAGNANNAGLASVRNSHVIIDGGTIKGSVYGGGDYGAVGSRQNETVSTLVEIRNGTVKGDVYGGSNSNGFSQSAYTDSSHIDINVYGGTVEGAIYGGSDTKGICYGTVNINVLNGTIGNVYGGGRGGYQDDTDFGTFVTGDVNVNIGSSTDANSSPRILENVYGGSAFGTVNAANNTATSSSYSTNVNVSSGTVLNSVFGGGKGDSTFTPKVVGDIEVVIDGGTIGKVFGGFDASGTPGADDVVYLNDGTIGNAFGGGNNANQAKTDIRLQGSTIQENLYGGSNLLGTVTESNIEVTSGSVVDIYGGNNLDGLTITTNVNVTGATITGDIYGGGNEAPSTTSNVSISGVEVNDVYGGGKKAGLTTSNILLDDVEANNVFGGSNISGVVTTSNVNINNSEVDAAYGGNNQGGSTTETHLTVDESVITNVFGGGDNASSGTSNVIINSGNITNVYGGGNEAGLTTSNVQIVNGEITNVFGGSNTLGDVGTSHVNIGAVPEAPDLSLNVTFTKRKPPTYMGTDKPTYSQITVELTNNSNQPISDWQIELNVPQATIYNNNTSSAINIVGDTLYINSENVNGGYNTVPAGGTYRFSFSVFSDTALTDFDVSGQLVGDTSAPVGDITIGSVYGGNNLGGVTTNANINAILGDITTIYGGGNEASVGQTRVILDNITAHDVYGGGNAAGVSGNTFLDIDNSTITGNVYGGGEEGIVEGNTSVFLTDASVNGNAFAGGNGSTAVVHGNSTITIDGTTEIGTASSVAPDSGCVFGSGNAASTGLEASNNSVASVNIVGGVIHGNVYGGPKMAVVYGTTETNIGTSAVGNNSLSENHILISGTVFGGGESNASGSDTYDWTFISVTEGIEVLIDGTDYLRHGHNFVINGSIFGSGNASSSSGESNITIKELGTMANPNKSVSIQRATNLVIDHSVIELSGAKDRTNDYADILYSFNMIDKMVIKNGTTLLLKHNANMLKELYSGVDKVAGLVPATVDINDNTKTVTKNVDNRIYMIPGQNLHVTVNQAATVYGKITGMTFFGMYNSYDNGTYRFGLYDDDISYGDAGNASLEIVGGSYVIGLHHTDHDITKDGFYSNYLNDDYTAVDVRYIDPSTIGKTGYRWTVGFEAIDYEFTLIASKYSSLGTYELQLIDFADGNTMFNVLGFDSSGLNSEVSFVDSNEVPRVGRTVNEANNILGLSMKTETQEWMGYGTTKLLSASNGSYTGDNEYRTDSRQLPPSLMFYLYHAKNISRIGRFGTVVMTLQAAIPKNEIDYDIKFITVTINLSAVNADSDSYDASITYDKKYEMPSSTSVNITNQSQFTTYYSLTTFKDEFSKVYGNNNDNFHVLVTNNPLPVGTMITMMDFSINDNRPEYYYYRVTQSVYDDSVYQLQHYNEITYRLSNFIKMDSTSSSNTYNDAAANLLYYDEDTNFVDEEFMFIFDFKECNVSGEHLENTMLFELRNSEDRTVFSVLGIREGLMVYNTYESSNVVLDQTFTDTDSYLYYNVADNFQYTTEVQYDETDNRESVIDTNYESSSMGLNIIFLDNNGEQISSSLLVGTSFKIDNREYFADGDGVFRIKLANKVSNLVRNASMTVNKDLPAGDYTIRYVLFASDDGLHNSVFENSVTEEFAVHVVSADNSIVVDCEDLIKVVDGDTGLNLKGDRTNRYHVKYNSQLNNPNIRVEVYKRAVDTVDSTTYNSVPFANLFSNNLTIVRDNEVAINMGEDAEKDFDFTLQNTLTSGTYRVVFKLYDSNQLIDDETKYVIVKKKIE